MVTLMVVILLKGMKQLLTSHSHHWPSQSTKVAHSSAMVLFDKMMSDKDFIQYPPFKDLHNDDVIEGKLPFIFVDFAHRLSHKPPTKAKSNDLLNVNTVCQYYSSVQLQFQARWPQNPYWMDQKQQSKITKDLKTNLERNSLTNGNGTGRYAICQPVYCKNAEIIGQSSQSGNIDLISVCKQFFKEQHSERGWMEKRCHLLLTYLACARGGEVKFLRYDNWIWDPFLLLLELRWSEAKTLPEHFMTFVSDANTYQSDIFHALGCFFALDDGLFRSIEAKSCLVGGFVFPSLHNIADKTVGANMTKLLQKFVPKEQASLKSRISSRSLRRGATTVLNVHKDVTFSEALARGGWSSGTNMDVYFVVNTAATLAGAKALSGWASARAQVYPPQLSVLGEHNRARLDSFMDHLFPRNNIPAFQKGSNLWPLLETCTATMIMYQRDFLKDYSSHNPLAELMNEAVEKTFGSPAGLTYLNKWSMMLKESFRIQNQPRTASDENVLDVLNRNLACMGELQTTVGQLNTKIGDLEHTVAVGNEETRALKKEICSLHEEIRSLKREQCEGLAAPGSSGRSAKRACSTTLADVSQDEPNEVEVIQVHPVRSSGQQRMQIAPAKRSVFDALKPKTSKTNTDQKSNCMSSLIVELYKLRQFHKGCSWAQTNLSRIPGTEKGKFRRAMEWAEQHASPIEKNQLCENGLDEAKLGKIAASIQHKCLVQLNVKEKRTNSKPTSRQRPTYLAIGGRLGSL